MWGFGSEFSYAWIKSGSLGIGTFVFVALSKWGRG